jgi:hypothetical protein
MRGAVATDQAQATGKAGGRRLAGLAVVAATASALALGACETDGQGSAARDESSPRDDSSPPPVREIRAADGMRASFGDSTTIDNAWLPLKPGTELIYKGATIEEGRRTAHRIVSTVTDLTKLIDGVRNLVVWERDFSAGRLVEAELALIAQDQDGAVWRFGEYPEEYENGKLVGTPAWIHGLQGAKAGLSMHARPSVGTPSYAQGLGPKVDWRDRAKVFKVRQRTCVPAGCYDDVVVTDEFTREEPGAHQLKYYAPGVGNVRVGWRGNDPSKETLVLTGIRRLTPQGMARARAAAFKLESRAYRHSKDVYGRTPRAELPADTRGR